MATPPDWTPLLWFGAVIALIPLALWLLKRTPMGGASSGGLMRSVAALPLSASQRIVTVEGGGAWVHGGGFATYHDARRDRHARLEWRGRQRVAELESRELCVSMGKPVQAISHVAASYRAKQGLLHHQLMEMPVEDG